MILRQKKPPTSGRPSDDVMNAYAERYGLSPKKKTLSRGFIVQLSLCRSDSARRLLLGVSRKEDAA